MDINTYCNNILEKYAEYISKEQMYKICHISKLTCLFLLENKLVPCIDNGQPTHRFKINKHDVVFYLKDREIHPEKYKVVIKPGSPAVGRAVMNNHAGPRLREFYSKLLSDAPDLMKPRYVSEFTGYDVSTIDRWCRLGRLKYLKKHTRYIIPKVYLLDFLSGTYYINEIHNKSDIHKEQMQRFASEYRYERRWR